MGGVVSAFARQLVRLPVWRLLARQGRDSALLAFAGALAVLVESSDQT